VEPEDEPDDEPDPPDEPDDEVDGEPEDEEDCDPEEEVPWEPDEEVPCVPEDDDEASDSSKDVGVGELPQATKVTAATNEKTRCPLRQFAIMMGRESGPGRTGSRPPS
jgi:hypothetical protein